MKTVQGLVNTQGAIPALMTDSTTIGSLNLQANILNSCFTTVANCAPILKASGNAQDIFLAVLNWNLNATQVSWSQLATNYNDSNYTPTASLSNATPLIYTFKSSASTPAQLIQPRSMVMDSTCDVWVGSDVKNNGYVTELNPNMQQTVGVATGTLGGSQSFNQPNQLALGDKGYIWIAEAAPSSGANSPLDMLKPATNGVTMTTSSGIVLSLASAPTLGGVVSLDSYGTTGSAGYHLTMHPTSGFFNPNISLSGPGLVATDPSGGIYTVTYPAGTTSTSTNTTLTVAQYTYTPPASSSSQGQLTAGPSYRFTANGIPTAVAVDAKQNLRMITSDGVEHRISFASTPLQDITLTDATTNAPMIFKGVQGMSMDALGNVWIAEHDADQISELAVNMTGSVSIERRIYPLPTGAAPVSVLVDPWGDVWAANNGNNTVSFLAGIAAPTGTCTPTASSTPTGSNTVAQPPSTDVNWNPTIQTIQTSMPAPTTDSYSNYVNSYYYYWGWNFILG